MSTDYTTRIVNYALETAGFYPLRPIQRWLIDTHFNKANSTMMNIGGLYKLDDSIDMEKLAAAITDISNAHDIFKCRLVFHEGTSDLCQRFDGEIVPVEVEKISDAEFEEVKKFLKKPYRLVNNPLYRIRLIETPTGKYFYSDFYHAILDGTAAGILFLHELSSRYKGKKITRTAPKYSDYVLQELRISPEDLVEGNNYWRNMLEGYSPEKHLPPADIQGKNNWQSDQFFVELKNINREYFSDRVRKEHIFFLAASMLATAKISGQKKSFMSWIHNGRTNTTERRLFGILLEQYPVSFDFEENLTVEKFLDGLEGKINEAPKYRRSLETVYDTGLQDDCATFIFQKGSLTEESICKLADKPMQFVEMPENKFSAAENILDIEITSLDSGKYVVLVDYDASRYSEGAMKKFAATLDEMVLQLQKEKKFISEILG